MKNIFCNFLLFFFCSAVISYAQTTSKFGTIQRSEIQEFKKRTKLLTSFKSDNHYYNLIKFNIDNLELFEYSEDLKEVKRIKLGSKKDYSWKWDFNRVFVLQDKIHVLFTDHKKGHLVLYQMTFNKEGEVIKEASIIHELNCASWDNFHITYSEKTKQFSVLNPLGREKAEVAASIFDKNFNLIENKKWERLLYEGYYINRELITEDGELILSYFKNENDPVKVVWYKKGNIPITTEFKVGKSPRYQMAYNSGKVSFVFHLSDVGQESKNWANRLTKGVNVKVFDSELKLIYDETQLLKIPNNDGRTLEDRDRALVNNHSTEVPAVIRRNVFFNNNGYPEWLVFEKYTMRKGMQALRPNGPITTNPTGVYQNGGPASGSDPHYFYEDIFIFHFDSSSKNNWGGAIEKYQHSTIRGEFGVAARVNNQNELVLLYNITKENRERPEGTPVMETEYAGSPHLSIFNSEGHVVEMDFSEAFYGPVWKSYMHHSVDKFIFGNANYKSVFMHVVGEK